LAKVKHPKKRTRPQARSGLQVLSWLPPPIVLEGGNPPPKITLDPFLWWFPDELASLIINQRRIK